METQYFRFMKAIDLEQFNMMKHSDWGQSLTYSDMLYLFVINHKESTKVSDLAKQLDISKSAVTQKMNEFESKGLIQKIQSQKDKRSYEFFVREGSSIKSENKISTSIRCC